MGAFWTLPFPLPTPPVSFSFTLILILSILFIRRPSSGKQVYSRYPSFTFELDSAVISQSCPKISAYLQSLNSELLGACVLVVAFALTVYAGVVLYGLSLAAINVRTELTQPPTGCKSTKLHPVNPVHPVQFFLWTLKRRNQAIPTHAHGRNQHGTPPRLGASARVLNFRAEARRRREGRG